MIVVDEGRKGDHAADDGRVPAEGHGTEAGRAGEKVDAPAVDLFGVSDHWEKVSANESRWGHLVKRFVSSNRRSWRQNQENRRLTGFIVDDLSQDLSGETHIGGLKSACAAVKPEMQALDRQLWEEARLKTVP